MPGPKRGFTTPHACATVDSMTQNQPSERDRKTCKKLQEKVSDFQVTFDDNVYLSIGLEAKCHIYNSFDLNEPYDIHLEPPSHDHSPLVKTKQKGKPLVYTTDFYFTNKLASNIVVRPKGTKNNSPNADKAEAADPAFFATDPLQPGKVCLHSWMLYTPQAPVLDLTGEHIKTKEDIEAAFHSLNLCTHDQQKSDGTKGHKASQSKYLSDSDSDDKEIDPRLKTSIEERQYNTIPESTIATQIALSHSRAQVNPTVERGPPQQKNKPKKSTSEDKKAESTST